MILQGENIVSGGSSVPIGMIIATISDTPDIGYLFGHGQSLNKNDYPILFSKIGYKFGGSGDYFNLPDTREASLVGAGTNVLNASAITSHNALIIAQFQDDQFQNHKTDASTVDGSGAVLGNTGTGTGSRRTANSVPDYAANLIASTAGTPRVGATTHGKQLGINYQIKVSNHGILPVNAIDDLQTTNANTWSAEHIANLTRTLRISADGTLSAYPDGSRLRLANISASTRSLTMPTGYTMNGQTSFTIAPDTILEFELIGAAWKCVSNEWEPLYTFESFVTGLTISFAQYESLRFELYCTGNYSVASRIIKALTTETVRIAFWENWGEARYGGVGVFVSGTNITGIATMMWQGLSFASLKIYGMK